MSDLTARDIHQLDQAAVDAASDVDALADDPETTLRLADRGPAVYAAQLTADLAAAAGERPMTLAAFAAWQTIRRVQERAKLRAEVERLVADIDDRDSETSTLRQDLDLQTKAAWDNNAKVAELTATVEHLRADADASRLHLAEQRVSLAQGLAEDWAGSKDLVLASAGRALLNVTGGAR